MSYHVVVKKKIIPAPMKTTNFIYIQSSGVFTGVPLRLGPIWCEKIFQAFYYS